MDGGKEAEIDSFVSTWGMRSRFGLRELYVDQNSFGVRMVADMALRKVVLKLRRADAELEVLAKRK